MGEDGKGAGSIEANATNGRGVDVVLGHCTLHAVTDAAPDVGCRLFLLESEILPVAAKR